MSTNFRRRTLATEPSTPGARPARLLSGPRLLGSLLILGYLGHVALRVAISHGRDGPTIFADEAGYLANARVMTGGVPGEFGSASFYRGGYSLLLLPAYWLGTGPQAEYRNVLATNALLSSLVFPLVHALLTRAFQVSARAAIAAAFVAALYPPLVVTTQFASAESLLPALVLLAAISIAGVVGASKPRAAVGWAVVCGSSAGALYTTHGRTAPLVAVLLALLLAPALLRRDLVAAALAGVVATAAVAAAGQALNEWLLVKSWGHPAHGDVERVLGNARDLGVLENVAALGAGQYWYVFVATLGLAVLGLVHAGAHLRPADRSAHRRLHPGPAAPRSAALRSAALRSAVGRETAGAPVVGAFLLGAAVGLAVLVGLFLRPPMRPDQLVYGRYIEILVAPLLALGLVRLWTARLPRVALELAIGASVASMAALIVMSYRGGLIAQGPVHWYNVLALPPMAQTREQVRPVTATLVALAAAGILLVATRRSRTFGALGLAAVFVASSIALRVVLVGARDQAIYGTQPVALSAVAGLNADHDVSYDLAAYTPIGLSSYQWQLDRARFVLFDSRRDPAPRTEWVIAGLNWRQAGQVGARRIWVHPEVRQAVWRQPPRTPAAAEP